jgi:hypothetical protein
LRNLSDLRKGAARVAIHLKDEQGIDRGTLDEAEITKLGKDS